MIDKYILLGVALSIVFILSLYQIIKFIRMKSKSHNIEQGQDQGQVGEVREIDHHSNNNFINYPNQPNDQSNTQHHLNNNWLFTITSSLIDHVTTSDERELHFIKPCTIQTVDPFPLHRQNCYFEITIISLPETTKFTIGLAPHDPQHQITPGHHKNSIGLESDTGSIRTTSLLHDYATKLSPGDTLGFGFRPNAHRIFYSKNGRRLPRIVFDHHHCQLYPTLTTDGPCVIQYNFGQLPFTLTSANNHDYGLSSLYEPSLPPPAYDTHSHSHSNSTTTILSPPNTLQFNLNPTAPGLTTSLTPYYSTSPNYPSSSSSPLSNSPYSESPPYSHSPLAQSPPYLAHSPLPHPSYPSISSPPYTPPSYPPHTTSTSPPPPPSSS